MTHGVCVLQISLIVTTQFYKMQGTLFASNQRLKLPSFLVETCPPRAVSPCSSLTFCGPPSQSHVLRDVLQCTYFQYDDKLF